MGTAGDKVGPPFEASFRRRLRASEVELTVLDARDEGRPLLVGVELDASVLVLAVADGDAFRLDRDLDAGLGVVLGPAGLHEVLVLHRESKHANLNVLTAWINGKL